MLVHNILLKHTQPKINILYSHSDNKEFIKILKTIYGNDSVVLLEESIFSHKGIDLIICNNRLESLDMCVALCYYFHTPLLIVDHKPKPDHLHSSQISVPKITHYEIAINQQIVDTWGSNLYNSIIDTDMSNPENIQQWKSCIDDIVNMPFKTVELKTA